MGNLVMAKCGKCGYSHIFKVGGGLNDSTYENFRNEFSSTQIKRIDQLISSRTGQISINRELKHCNKCNALFIMPVALVRFPEEDIRVEDVCKDCGSQQVEESANGTPCPKCGAKLEIQSAGLWD